MSRKHDLIQFLTGDLAKSLHDSTALENALNLVKQAQLFVIVAELSDEHIEFGEDLMRRGLFRMPYEHMLIYFQQPEGHKGLAAVSVNEASWWGHAFVCNDKVGISSFAATSYFERDGIPDDVVKYNQDLSGKQDAVFIPITNRKMSELGIDAALAREHSNSWGYWLKIVTFATASMLMSKSVDVERVEPSAKANRARERQGKYRLEPYHIVKIRRSAPRSSPEAITYDERKSPRQHFRRGHFRDLPNGKTIPIAPCLVGARENGFVDKEYHV
jgi:hypothetical protein